MMEGIEILSQSVCTETNGTALFLCAFDIFFLTHEEAERALRGGGVCGTT